jgi:3-deoxy-D-manno-octulosonate 8-phosphate phosphatase (KDO 8-P phosphatase)
MELSKLKHINTIIFDVDGVLTDGSVFVTENGEQCRTFNTRDGYAMQLAVKCGLRLCAITGGKAAGVRHRLNGLGITDVFLGASNKLSIYLNYAQQHQLNHQQVLYMGDDIPDLEVMQTVGFAACPADATEEIKSAANYISPVIGGRGCMRDVIEKTLKLQGKWMAANATSI